MSLDVIVTMGPSIQNADILRRIDGYANCIYRLNGAHVSTETGQRLIKFIRNTLGDAKILIDLPGNKVRTENVDDPIVVERGKTFSMFSSQFNYKEFYRCIKKGDQVLASDSTLTFEVISTDSTTIQLLSHSDGFLLNRKGMHVHGIHGSLPFLFEKDLGLIDLALTQNVYALGLSFVRNEKDVDEVIQIVKGSSVKLFPKVEKISAARCLDSILDRVETIIVDRGDLSTETGLLELASYQHKIVEHTKRRGKKVILATQFLKNMETKQVPLIPEAVDLFNSIHMGVDGIQLSEETAVGKFPEECVSLISKMHALVNKNKI